MYEQSLTQAGLTEEMAKIYEILLKQGPKTAGKLAKKAELKRGLTYKTLERLLEKQLVEKSEEDAKVAVFSATHPLKLQDLVEARQNRAKNAQLAVENALPALVSDFNLLIGKPGVIFYEGFEGLKKVLYDSLKAKTEIYQYIDSENIVQNFSEIDKEYTKKRNSLGIKKKMLAVDCEYIRTHPEDYNRETSDVRIINKANTSFNSTMLIYDNKISYLTTNKKIGVLIEDADIAHMHKMLFEYAWEKAELLFKD